MKVCFLRASLRILLKKCDGCSVLYCEGAPRKASLRSSCLSHLGGGIDSGWSRNGALWSSHGLLSVIGAEETAPSLKHCLSLVQYFDWLRPVGSPAFAVLFLSPHKECARVLHWAVRLCIRRGTESFLSTSKLQPGVSSTSDSCRSPSPLDEWCIHKMGQSDCRLRF